MKYNGKTNIITTEDVTLVGNSANLGNSLDEVLVNQQNDLLNLKSNVKWLYKYGGVGSGSGGGIGGSSKWKVSIAFNSVNLSEGSTNTLPLSGPKSYLLRVIITNAKDSTLSMLYTYGTLSNRIVLDASNGWSASIPISISSDNKLSVVITDGSITKEYIADCYLYPYVIDKNLSLYGKNGDTYTLITGVEFFSDTLALYEAIYARLGYRLVVDAPILYMWEGESNYTTFDKDTTYILKLVATREEDGYTTGLYTVSIKIKESNIDNPYTLSSVFNIWPSDLYLSLIESAPFLYPNLSTEEPSNVKYLNQIFTFKAKIIDGSMTSRTYNVEYSSDLKNYNGIVRERAINTYEFKFEKTGWHLINIKIYLSNDVYNTKTFSYWVYIKELQVNTNEWPNEYGRIELLKEVIDKEIYDNSLPVLYDFKSYRDQSYLFAISIGILFNKLNNNYYSEDSDKCTDPIIELNNDNSNSSIKIWLNKVCIQSNDIKNTFDIFIPYSDINDFNNSESNDYHLITICSEDGGGTKENPRTSYKAYIDGVLDGSTSSTLEGHILPKYIKFNAGSYKYKYISANIFEHTVKDETKNYQEKDIVSNYYWFLETMFLKAFNNDFLNLLLKASFKYGPEDLIKVDSDFVSSLSDNLKDKVPVLILKFNSPNTDIDKLGEGKYSILEWMSSIPALGLESGILDADIIVNNITYNNLDIPPSSDYEFYIEMQGSSTLSNKAKNFNLGIKSKLDEEKFIYSPNLLDIYEDDTEEEKKRKRKTYLPEEIFTLKADVVDSAHTNNTATGAFVYDNHNYNINYGYNVSAKYYSYIKKCLLGFSIILIIEIEGDSYFMGIYNFNLGRDSYFNLGYYDPAILDNVEKVNDSGFKIYKINNEQAVKKEELIVCEILDNDNYWDFSLYDDSILFKSDGITETEMFGKFVYGATASANFKNNIKNFVKQVSRAGGYLFKTIGKTFKNIGDGNEYAYHTPHTVPNYQQLYIKTGNGSYKKKSSEETVASSIDLNTLIYGDEENQIEPYINYDSIVYYYTTCMTLGLVDSVLKNLNLKSWDSHSFGAYFYDMDTSHGKDNEGNLIPHYVFSDYYKSNINDDGYIIGSNVYRDYYPIKSSNVPAGYDIPSSYLFAIAKYTNHSTNGSNYLFYELITPLLLWSDWRSTNGPLRNAKYYIDTYYKDYLKDVPEFIFNLNYITKYFYSRDIPDIANSFSGRNIYRTQEWLESRLHILDLYFNILTLNINLHENASSENSFYVKNPLTTVENDDIVISKDIFTINNLPYQANGKMDITVLANEDYFPIQIRDGSNYYDMLFDAKYSNFKYTHNFTNTRCLLGGSAKWYKIENFNSILTAISSDRTELVLNNTNLSNVNISVNKPYSTYNFYLPNVYSINLNSNSFTGELKINGNDEDKPYFKLDTINISNSKISLSASNLDTLKTVNVSNVIANSLLISNCNNLLTINLTNTQIKNITISYKGNVNLNNCKNTSISITGNGNSTFTYTNDESLTDITLTGFKEINIDNCPKLKSITVTDPEIIKTLNVTNCSRLADSFTIGEIENQINLSIFDNIESFKFLDTVNFNTIRLKEGISVNDRIKYYLWDDCFNGCRHLNTIIVRNNALCLCGPRIFKNAQNIKIRTPENKEPYNSCSFEIPYENTSLEECFASDSIVTNDSSDIFTWISALSKTSNKDNIASIKKICYNRNINISFETLWPGFSLDFKNCSDAREAFSGCNLNHIQKSFFGTLGKNTKVDIDGIFSRGYPKEGDDILYLDINLLLDILPRLTGTLRLDSYFYSQRVIQFCTYDHGSNHWHTEIKGTVDLSKFFVKQNSDDPCYISCIQDFDLCSGNTYDLSNVFLKNRWPELKSFETFLGRLNYDNFVVNNGVLYTLQHLPKLQTVSWSFKIDNKLDPITPESIYGDIINYESILPDYKGYKRSDLNGEGLRPVILYNNIKEFNDYAQALLKRINKNKGEASDLMAYSIVNTTSGEIDLGDVPYNNITTVSGIFNKVSFVSNNLKYPIKFKLNVMQLFPNGKYYDSAFANTNIGTRIPFNFFGKRQDASTIDVLVENDKNDYNIPATLTVYNYKQDIISLRRIFKNVIWEKDACNFDSIPSNYEFNSLIGEDGTEYDEGTLYKTSASIYTPSVFHKSTEFLDCLNLNGCREEGKLTDISFLNTPLLDQYSDEKLFIAPDIFYGCDNTAILIEVFAESYNDNTITTNKVLEGLMPRNLLKNCKSVELNNTFLGVHLLPYIKEDNENEKICVFIPSNFTECLNLTNAFTFLVEVPNPVDNIYLKHTSYYVLQSDSVNTSKVSRYESAFPYLIKSNGESVFFTSALSHNYHYNLMYDVSTGNSGIKFNFNTDYTNIIRGAASVVISGRIFEEGTIMNNIKYNDKSYIIYIITNVPNSIYTNVILPKATGIISGSRFMYGNNNFINATSIDTYSTASPEDREKLLNYYKNSTYNVKWTY